MQVDMIEMKPHDVTIRGIKYQIRTGRVANGWWWKCTGFECDGVKASRQQALHDACAEIEARTL